MEFLAPGIEAYSMRALSAAVYLLEDFGDLVDLVDFHFLLVNFYPIVSCPHTQEHIAN